jgi:predicted DNA-binding protein
MAMKNRTTTIAAKVSDGTNEKLDYVAQQLGVTKSTLILRLINDNIDTYIEAAKLVKARNSLACE